MVSCVAIVAVWLTSIASYRVVRWRYRKAKAERKMPLLVLFFSFLTIFFLVFYLAVCLRSGLFPPRGIDTNDRLTMIGTSTFSLFWFFRRRVSMSVSSPSPSFGMMPHSLWNGTRQGNSVRLRPVTAAAEFSADRDRRHWADNAKIHNQRDLFPITVVAL